MQFSLETIILGHNIKTWQRDINFSKKTIHWRINEFIIAAPLWIENQESINIIVGRKYLKPVLSPDIHQATCQCLLNFNNSYFILRLSLFYLAPLQKHKVCTIIHHNHHNFLSDALRTWKVICQILNGNIISLKLEKNLHSTINIQVTVRRSQKNTN